MIYHLCEWLEATAIATMVRESLWGFPILVAIHIVSLTFSAGLVVWVDLRLLGVGLRSVPVSAVYRRVMSIAAVGFVLMVVSGGMLATGFATAAYGNLYFRIKIIMLALAAANAIFYHAHTERTIAQWDRDRRPPTLARAAGLVSIGCWTIVILAGRFISYTLYTR